MRQSDSVPIDRCDRMVGTLRSCALLGIAHLRHRLTDKPMPLSWNEIKSRSLAFSKKWADAGNEDSQAKPFLIDFFECFGITDKRVATFEHAVKKHGGGNGYVDLFWPGILLIEMKSRGKDLDRAYTQAMDYFPGIAERDLPRYVLVSDFVRFRLHDLSEGKVEEFALADLYKN